MPTVKLTDKVIKAVTAIYSDIEAKRNFNYREGDVYRIIGTGTNTKTDTPTLILEITPENGNPSFTKEIDPRNILPFGLRNGQPTANQLNGNNVESYSEVIKSILTDEGFTVEFIDKADGFGTKYDADKHTEEQLAEEFTLAWGANHYKLRVDAVQLVNIITA